jgi:hypothetical protein
MLTCTCTCLPLVVHSIPAPPSDIPTLIYVQAMVEARAAAMAEVSAAFYAQCFHQQPAAWQALKLHCRMQRLDIETACLILS